MLESTNLGISFSLSAREDEGSTPSPIKELMSHGFCFLLFALDAKHRPVVWEDFSSLGEVFGTFDECLTFLNWCISLRCFWVVTFVCGKVGTEGFGKTSF